MPTSLALEKAAPLLAATQPPGRALPRGVPRFRTLFGHPCIPYDAPEGPNPPSARQAELQGISSPRAGCTQGPVLLPPSPGRQCSADTLPLRPGPPGKRSPLKPFMPFPPPAHPARAALAAPRADQGALALPPPPGVPRACPHSRTVWRGDWGRRCPSLIPVMFPRERPIEDCQAGCGTCQLAAPQAGSP